MRKSDWRGVSILAWCLAVLGTIVFMISPVAPENLIPALFVAAGALLTSAAAIFIVGQLRT